MTHLDDERLAAYALDPAEVLTAEERDHLQQCDQCTDELAALRQLVAPAAAASGAPTLQAPPDRVWAAIATELAADGPAADQPAPTPLRPAGTSAERPDRTRRRNWWGIGLVAALVGVLVGVLGTVAIRAAQTPAEQVVSEIALQPLPGKAGAGRAELVETPDGLQLRVSLSDISVPDADLEVWLINADGQRMRSLGFAGDTGGTFPVPGWLIPEDYRIVDVSVEPRDGDLAHSTDSEVRGTLP